MTLPAALLGRLERRAHEAVRPGQVDTVSGQLAWDTEHITLDGQPMPRPAAQLTRRGLRPARGLARLWRWLRRPRDTLFVEVRAGTQRVRLRADAMPDPLHGLAELPLDLATDAPLDTVLNLLHAVRAHDGRLLIDAAAPTSPPADDAAPGSTTEVAPDTVRAAWLRPVLRVWPLWLAGLAPAIGHALAFDTLPQGWRELAVWGYLVGPWLTATPLWGLAALFGKLDARWLGGATGLSCALWAAVLLIGSWGQLSLADTTTFAQQALHVPIIAVGALILHATRTVRFDALEPSTRYLLIFSTLFMPFGALFSPILLAVGWGLGADLATGTRPHPTPTRRST